MKSKTKFILAGISGLTFVVLICLVLSVDVRPLGWSGNNVGLSHLNQFVFDLFGANTSCYTLTQLLGYFAILVALGFAALGFLQLIKRKSLLKVDREILFLGALYACVIVFYALFEVFIVNYRPIRVSASETKPEASFPSSHTMLVCTVMGSAIFLIGKYVKNKVACRGLQILSAVIIFVMVAGRLISGVHWFTDILGGLLLSAALLLVYFGCLDVAKESENKFTIREETDGDHGEVENLVREAFWNVYRPGCSEHFVLHTLRSDPDFVKDLDFVMVKGGKIIGQNIFMKAAVKTDDGREIPVLTMGPICVAPELQGKGYGKALLDYSLIKAAEKGYGAVILEGDIAFYGKCGFEYAKKFGIRYHGLEEGADDSFFLAKELTAGYLGGISGEYSTPQGYFVSDEKVEEFDKNFPPKEKRE